MAEHLLGNPVPIDLVAVCAGRDPAAAQDDHPVGQIEQFVSVGACDEDSASATSRVPDLAMDLGAGADIDPLGWLVQQEELGLSGEPSRHDHLLLIPTG